MIIIGSGISGMMSAYVSCKNGVETYLVTKDIYSYQNYTWSSKGGCSWKTHAFNVATGEDDSPYEHFLDTMEGSSNLANPILAYTLCDEAPSIIDTLDEIGVIIERDSSGKIHTKPFGGCGVPRAVHIEDRLGFHITKGLNDQLKKFEQSGLLKVINNTRIIELHKEEDIYKLKALNLETNEVKMISSNTVVFADGGGASMYSPSASTLDKTCDGITLASKLGLNLIDMEFMQFHPTGLISENPQFNGSLFEESLRFAGAKIYNKEGKRFLFDYLELGEQATRDKVSRAIYMEIQKGNCFENGGVKLDFSDCYDLLMEDYPALLERLKQAGYDPESEKFVYIKPTAHFMMGGVEINEKCETNQLGLYFTGESAGGVHGANRLGGNGLTEALVYGKIAGESASKYAKNNTSSVTINEVLDFDIFNYSEDKSELLDDMKVFKEKMYDLAGLVRTESSLKEMLEIIEEYQSKSYPINQFNYKYLYNLKLDFSNYLTVSKFIVLSALERKESRGSHFRSDFSQSNSSNENFRIRTINNQINIEKIDYSNTRSFLNEKDSLYSRV